MTKLQTETPKLRAEQIKLQTETIDMKAELTQLPGVISKGGSIQSQDSQAKSTPRAELVGSTAD